MPPGGPESLLTRFRWTAYVGLHLPWQGRFPFRSLKTVQRAQERRLRSTVSHAYEHVPYYRETMDRLGLRPGSIGRAADLAKLPLILREQVQRDPEYFVSNAQPVERCLKLRTGGSSGQPLTLFFDPFTLFQGAVHHLRHRAVVRSLIGSGMRVRQALIDTPSSSAADISNVLASRSLIPIGLRAVDERFSMRDSPARNIELLNDFQPDVVRTFGSYLEALFVYLSESDVRFVAPRAVVYGADALSDSVRRLINDDFGIPVLGAYGATEAFHIGFECGRHSGYHLNSDLYPVRIVDAEGQERAPGESGEVVVSNLVNRGNILLNYRLGDLASKLPDRCPCGRSLALLSFLEGRVDDWLEMPSGERSHPQTVRTLFTHEEEVWRYRVVQHTPSRFCVEVVAASDCNREALRTRLEQKFSERLGAGPRTDVAFVEALPRTARGKVRTVVSSRVT